MKSADSPFALPLLLLLLGASAVNVPLPAPWNLAWLPGCALLALGGCLLAGSLPGRIWVAGGCLLGLIFLYAWNPSHEWSAGRGLMPRAHWRGWPASADSAGTWATLCLGVAAFAAFASGFVLSRRQIRRLEGFVAVAAAAMALVVLAQRLEPNAPRIRAYTGIFVNENHYAVYANLLLPVVLAAAARARFRAVQAGRPSSPAGLYLLAAGLAAAATVACGSRAGVAVMALLVAACVAWHRRTVRDYPFAGIPASRGLKVAAAAAVVAAAGFAVRAFWNEWRHLGTIGKEWAFRSGILKDALAAWQARPVWGIGPGAFPAVFPYYQSDAYAGLAIRHAHCEPVQFGVEYGGAGLLALAAIAALALSARKPVRAEPDEIPSFADFERRAFGLGLVACALHGVVDFPLRIPLLALIAAAWAGIWLGARPATSGAEPLGSG